MSECTIRGCRNLETRCNDCGRTVSTATIAPMWIKCSDRLPEYNISVLAFDTQKIYIAFRQKEEEYNEHWSICEDDCCSCVGCTGAIVAWMPLPKETNE